MWDTFHKVDNLVPEKGCNIAFDEVTAINIIQGCIL